MFDLLVYLVQHRDRIVSKDELIETIWHGRVISEAALSSRISAARRALGDNGNDQTLIRTLHKRGFRFVGEVEEGSAPAAVAAGPSPLPQPAAAHDAVKLVPSAELLPLPDKPSIAVLPFQNMSHDPEQEYFADGLTEDIITGLSRQRWFFVIARNSSFTYKGAAVDVRDVATQLGVRYVLEGSVRKAANRVRVTGQLIDASNGNHLWAEKYDRELRPHRHDRHPRRDRRQHHARRRPGGPRRSGHLGSGHADRSAGPSRSRRRRPDRARPRRRRRRPAAARRRRHRAGRRRLLRGEGLEIGRVGAHRRIGPGAEVRRPVPDDGHPVGRPHRHGARGHGGDPWPRRRGGDRHRHAVRPRPNRPDPGRAQRPATPLQRAARPVRPAAVRRRRVAVPACGGCSGCCGESRSARWS